MQPVYVLPMLHYSPGNVLPPPVISAKASARTCACNVYPAFINVRHAAAQVAEVWETFLVCARLGTQCVEAYVISMASCTSDILAVELLKREACRKVPAQQLRMSLHMAASCRLASTCATACMSWRQRQKGARGCGSRQPAKDDDKLQ